MFCALKVLYSVQQHLSINLLLKTCITREQGQRIQYYVKEMYVILDVWYNMFFLLFAIKQCQARLGWYTASGDGRM